MAKIESLTVEQKARFPEFVNVRYEPKSGLFFWRKKGRNRRLNKRVGSKDPRGYIKIRIAGKQYWAHQLAWYFSTGKWPSKDIDHKNRDKSDNRISNLREVNRSLNLHNRTVSTNGGIKGITFHKKGKKWMAQITVDYKRHYLGLFSTKELAQKARLLAEKELLVI